MKLEDLVYKCINNYPSLNWTGYYKTARILVLNHLFLTIGTEYGWTPDGYLLSQDTTATRWAFEMPQGWYAVEAPTYGVLTYTNRQLPDKPYVHNYESHKPYQMEPDYTPDNMQPDYAQGLADVLEWAQGWTGLLALRDLVSKPPYSGLTPLVDKIETDPALRRAYNRGYDRILGENYNTHYLALHRKLGWYVRRDDAPNAASVLMEIYHYPL